MRKVYCWSTVPYDVCLKYGVHCWYSSWNSSMSREIHPCDLSYWGTPNNKEVFSLPTAALQKICADKKISLKMLCKENNLCYTGEIERKADDYSR
jgi:hypothetical protein